MNIKPLKIGDLIAKVPIIQGGMGVGVSLSNLAGNVAKKVLLVLFLLLMQVIWKKILKLIH